MENGEWKMENGKWRMENGEWKMENVMRYKSILIMMAALPLLAACSHDLEVEELMPLRIGAVVDDSGAQTRNQSEYQATELATGQKVGVYVYYSNYGSNTGDWTTTTDNYGYKNIEYTVTGNAGALTSPSTQPYYPPNASQKVVIYGFAPRTKFASITGELSAQTAVAVDFTDQRDQSAANGANYLATDFVWGKVNSTLSADKNKSAIDIPLTHKMSKVAVILTEGNGMSGRLAGATVTLESNVVTKAKVNLTNGTVTADGSTKNTVTLAKNITKSGSTYSCNAVIVPQTIAAGNLLAVTLSSTYGNTKYYYKTTAATTFNANTCTTYNITVNATAITVSTSISDWGTKNTVTDTVTY